jgi:hypothetical protein
MPVSPEKLMKRHIAADVLPAVKASLNNTSDDMFSLPFPNG